MNLKKCFTFIAIAAMAFGAESKTEEKAVKSPMQDKTLAEWWEMTATQTSLAKQFSDAQAAMKAIPEEYVKNGKAMEEIKAKLAKECESANQELQINQQTNKPACIAKPPAAEKSAAKKEENKK